MPTALNVAVIGHAPGPMGAGNWTIAAYIDGLAVGIAGSTFADHRMRWDNSGKNGHCAPINWSN